VKSNVVVWQMDGEIRS